MSFTYKSFGSRFYGGQIDRIDKGFTQLGGKQVDTNPDFIYSNDSGGYDEAIKLKKENPNSKLILNVLDVPSPYIGHSYDLTHLYKKLDEAQAITAISAFVQGQLMHFLNLESYIIYNPIKEINAEQRKNGVKKYNYKALMVGRVNDKYKRGDLSIKALIMAAFKEEEVAIVGSEKPAWGTYLGIVTDEVLNDLYNSVDFVMMCSNFEGMGLPGNEAIAAGAIPIVCSDLPTISEFYPREWWCYPSPEAISMYLQKYLQNPDILMFEKAKALLMSPGVIKAFSGETVAKRIFQVYEKIK